MAKVEFSLRPDWGTFTRKVATKILFADNIFYHFGPALLLQFWDFCPTFPFIYSAFTAAVGQMADFSCIFGTN